MICFFLINLHTIPHNDKAKTGFRHFCKCTVFSLLSTLLKHLWQWFQPRLSHDATCLAHLYLGSFSHSSFTLKLCQVGWGASLHSYFQIYPEILDWVQVRALAGPLLRCLGCVLRVIVLLEGEPSPQSEVLSALEQVFIKLLSLHCLVHLSLDSD